ncbi:MAG: hypothetical protein BMS9Abin29_2197 [Gemmatimonadota bacterium]|nr:MAG: hypothetical protein BMS9Abin29_2197 [Gemmatimonadota bacterium]
MSHRTSSLVLLFLLGVTPLVVGATRPDPTGPGSAVELEAPHRPALQSDEGLSADRLEHDFGSVRIDGGKVTTRFKMKNGTAGATRLTELYSSCMCTSVRLEFADSRVAGPFGMRGHDLPTTLDRTLEPGEEFVASVTFDPAAHGPAGVGAVTRQVMFQTAERGSLVLTVRANVLPPKS